MLALRRLAPLILFMGLSACGGSDPASDPMIVTPTPTPTPAPTPTPTPSPSAPNVTFTTTGRNGVTITNDEQRAVVLAGTNNILDGTDPLDGYRAKGAAAQVAAFDASGLGAGLVRTGFIGALDPVDPTAFDDWTCTRTSPSQFRPADTTLCANAPTRITSNPCPDGTSRTSTIQGGVQPGPDDYGCLLPTRVTRNLHLTADKVYVLEEGVTTVGSDVGAAGDAANGNRVTVTVDPGALFIRKEQRSSPVLAVSRGSKIFINGTREQPVTFYFQMAIAISGRAPISNCGTGTSVAAGTCENSQSSQDGNNGNRTIATYGGMVADDSSGSIHYLQVLAPGFDPGLALFGVGSGTAIDHLAVTGANAEAVRIVGGTANLSYLFAVDARDPALAVGQGWRGAAQFVIGTQRAVGQLRSGWVILADNPEGDDVLPRTRATFANYTLIQPGGYNRPGAILLGNGVDAALVNGIAKTGLACISMAASTEANGGKSTIRSAGGTGGVPTTIDEAGPPRFASNYFACLGR